MSAYLTSVPEQSEIGGVYQQWAALTRGEAQRIDCLTAEIESILYGGRGPEDLALLDLVTTVNRKQRLTHLSLIVLGVAGALIGLLLLLRLFGIPGTHGGGI